MASKLSIAKDLVSVLKAFLPLTAQIGNNLFPLFAPEGTKGNFVIYARTGYGSKHTLMGNVNENCEITYNAVSENYKMSIEIAESIRSALIDTTIDGQTLDLIRSSEEYDGTGNTLKFVQVLVFGIGEDAE